MLVFFIAWQLATREHENSANAPGHLIRVTFLSDGVHSSRGCDAASLIPHYNVAQKITATAESSGRSSLLRKQ